MKHGYLIVYLIFGLLLGVSEGNGQVVPRVEKKSAIVEIKIFPNPTSNFFSLSVKDVRIARISISNIVGKEVKTLKPNTANSYDIQNLRRGIYIVRLYGPRDNLIKALRLSKT